MAMSLGESSYISVIVVASMPPEVIVTLGYYYYIIIIIIIIIINKLLIYNSIVKSTVTYGAQTWKFNKNLESNLCRWKSAF